MKSLGYGTVGDMENTQYLSGWYTCLMSSDAKLVYKISTYIFLPYFSFIFLISSTSSGCPFNHITLLLPVGLDSITRTGRLLIVLLMLKVGTGLDLRQEMYQYRSVLNVLLLST